MKQTIYPWQHTLWQRIVSLQARDRLPHAWLITGSVGVGKTDFAKHFAHALLCPQSTTEPCGNCLGCKLYTTDQHPDYYVLNDNDSGKISTETVRELREAMQQTAQQNGARVILINPAEQLTLSAANALLKLIEEPPEKVYFILITARPILLPATLRSRCQTLHCVTPTQEQAVAWLTTQVHTPEFITKALQLCYGAPLHALELLNDPKRLTQYEHCVNQFLAILNKKQSALEVAAEWAKQEETVLLALVQYCLLRLVRQASGMGERKAGAGVSVEHLLQLYQLTLEGYQQLLAIPGLNRQLFWERFLLSL